MRLSEEQILKAASGSPAPTPGLEIARLVQAGADAAIAALANTPDEELVLSEKEMQKLGTVGRWSSTNRLIIAKAQLTKAQTIYAAREQKAVEAERERIERALRKQISDGHTVNGCLIPEHVWHSLREPQEGK